MYKENLKEQQEKIGQQKVTEEDAKKFLQSLKLLNKVLLRLALKVYVYNSSDDIFTDGTFDKSTLDVIKKEGEIVKQALKYAENELRKG